MPPQSLSALMELAVRGLQSELAALKLRRDLYEVTQERDEALDRFFDYKDESLPDNSVKITLRSISDHPLSVLIFWRDSRGALEVADQFQAALDTQPDNDFYEICRECSLIDLRLLAD